LLVGDPGCLVTVADRLDAKFALGSAVGVADGLSRAGVEERPVAVFGDSSFFHSALPAVCNSVHNKSRILMVLLDNKATATSGFQVNPGVGRDVMGRDVPALDIERIVRSCGVRKVFVTQSDEFDPGLEETFRAALDEDELTLVIVRLKASGSPA
jgi:indolepyruvate ferredoxin oxidoreductase alpha subunit